MFPAYGPVPTGLVAANCPRYTIDLDLPAIDRWRELVGVYRDIIRSADIILDTQLRDALPRLGPILRGVAETAASAAAKLNRVMFKDDLTAFAELCDIPLGRVIALQLIYEASALCTSVVSQLGSDVTTPVHIRTMDWEMPFLRPLTVELLFVRGGQPLFICTTWAGYVGVLTGMRCDPADASKNFSISINFRSPGDGTFWTNVGRAMDGAWPIGFLVRESLQEATGFKQAASWLRASELIAPCYVTITGPTSGELITRNRTFVPPSTDEPNPDNHLALDSAPGGAIVQTNADHWIDPTVDRSADIMESAERRKLTHRGLTARNCCAADPMWAESLWNVMSQYPVCNEITIYGTLMVPALAIYETRIPAMQPAGGRRVRLGLRATPPSTRPRVTADDYPTCKNCGQRFDPTVNAKGQCAHTKPWHAAYADCQKLKCGWGLGPSNIGKQHWGCCFSTDRDLEVRCSESGPHEA